MLDAVGDILPLAVGVALSPLPIIAVVLMLVGRRARANGPLFVVGWLVGLGIVGTIVLAIAGPTDANEDGDPATWVGVLQLGVAVPVVIYFALGDRASETLQRMKTWMGIHNAAIMSVLCLVIGVKLIGDGLSAL